MGCADVRTLATVSIGSTHIGYICHAGTRDHYIKDYNYCAKCGHEYSGMWRPAGVYYATRSAGWYHTCPACGQHHTPATLMEVWIDQTVPRSMTLKLEEIADGARLTVTGASLRVTEDGLWHRGKYREVFKFDARHRRTTHTTQTADGKKATHEIGNPFDDYISQYETTMIRHLQRRSCNEETLHAVTQLMQKLRNRVSDVLAHKVGHKVSSMYTAPGDERTGLLLIPIANIAYRMIFIDAQNLPNVYRVTGERDYMMRNWSCGLRETYLDMDAIRKAPSTVAGVIQSMGFPNVAWVRRALTNFSLYSIRWIQAASELFHDTNCAGAAYEKAAGRMLEHSRAITRLIDIYGEAKTVRILPDKASALEWDDHLWMLGQLSEKSYQQLKKMKPRIRDLHDVLQDLQWRDAHPLVDFKYDAARRRLEMQTDMVKLFLPKKSDDIYQAAKEFHNCVASYTGRIESGMTNVVLMTDDSGKLVCCIETANGYLHQAKLKYNKPACNDAKINAEVIEWARKMGIDYSNCGDVREIRLPALLTA